MWLCKQFIFKESLYLELVNSIWYQKHQKEMWIKAFKEGKKSQKSLDT